MMVKEDFGFLAGSGQGFSLPILARWILYICFLVFLFRLFYSDFRLDTKPRSPEHETPDSKVEDTGKI